MASARTNPDLRSWRVIARLLARVTLVLLGTACNPAVKDQTASDLADSHQTTRDPGDDDQTARYLDEWYSCIECDAGQLDSLVMQGRGPHANSVWRELSRAIRNGPRAADLGAFQVATEADYDSVQASLQRLKQEALSQSKSEYAKDERDTYDRLYRARAAIALVRIDKARARPVVDSAARGTKDPSLLDAFARVLRDTLTRLTPP